MRDAHITFSEGVYTITLRGPKASTARITTDNSNDINKIVEQWLVHGVAAVIGKEN